MTSEQSVSPDLLSLAGAIIISAVSGFISITQQIVRGYEPSILWVMHELASALLFGYLASNLYSEIFMSLPSWITRDMFIVLAAYSGTKTIELVEQLLFQRYGIELKPRDKNGRK